MKRTIVGVPGHVPTVEAITLLRQRPISPAPKPAPPPPKKRQFSSIKPKSHAEKLTALRSQGPRKALPKQNQERIARKNVSYREGMAAYKRSDCYKQVELRAGGRCEKWVLMDGWGVAVRCDNRRGMEGVRLSHHHATYARFGGNELQADMLVLCKPHHDEVENSLRPWNRNRRRA